MRVRDVQRIFRYWARYPTVRDMVAGYLGIRPEAPGMVPPPTTEAEMQRAILMHGTVNHG